KRMEDWLNNMGDWCISRKRYWGLPLPFYRDPEDDEAPIFVVESLAHLRQVAVDPAAVDALPELHRPWIDDIEVRHPETGRILERVSEVGDCWLDAGIVPFATMGWHSEEQEGLDAYATGASVGLSTAPLPSHEAWEKWFPADIVIEMREQVRLWFYSMLFMSVVLLEDRPVEERSPYRRVGSYEKVHDETGRAMHKSWGNAIWFDDAVEKMGADVMRWQYAQQNPAQNLSFGYGPAQEIKKRFLTLWNVLSFFTQYANSDGWVPDGELFAQAAGGVDEAGLGLAALDPTRFANPLDQWLASRTHQLVSETSAALGSWNTPAYTRAVDAYIEELSNWYVRRSRRRFWKAELGEADRAEAYAALWSALVVVARVLAPVMPFVAEELWATLVTPHEGAVDAGAADSVHLAYWPVADTTVADHTLLGDVGAVQRVLALGRAARSSSKLKLRQPLREVVVYSRSRRGEGTNELQALLDRWSGDVLAELSLKKITVIDDPQGLWSESLMPLLPRLGPKYGKDVAQIRAAVNVGDVEILEDGRARVGAFTLEEDEFEYRSTAGEGYALAEDAEWVIAVSTTLDDELVAEGRAREIVRQLQQLRKDSGLDISDRVSVTWSADGPLADAFRAHGATIADEVLATSFVEGEPAADAHEFTLESEVARVELVRV
ncbi:MAG: isoleucyl-tRNA synthetase, partial [Thermoleophilia bacterium]|nr:isoleucyl-tRNA synthetase [Thermoleophilia bacterium]